MEKTVNIVQQSALVERPYEDRNGQSQMYASMGFILSDGVDSFYAEMLGDQARKFAAIRLDKTIPHRVQTQMCAREYKDRDGNSHYSNEIRIIRIM